MLGILHNLQAMRDHISITERIYTHFTEARHQIDHFLADADNIVHMATAANALADALKRGNKVYTCGNGGSMADAMHLAEELTGRYRGDRKPLPALAISDPSYISCAANDYGYQTVFARFVEAFGRKGDVLVCFSTSGNSANVLEAARMGRLLGMKVVALTGKDGGRLAEVADIELRAPNSQYADRAQEMHIKMVHALIDAVEAILGLAE